MEILTDKRRSLRMTEQLKDKIIFTVCLVCMFLFLFSAYDKIISHEQFYRGLSKVAAISSAAKIISWAVPVSEIIVSVLLIIPFTNIKGLYGFTGLMVVFTMYIFYMWIWAAKLPCHCNLLVENLTWGQHVWFNIAFIVLAILAIVLQKRNLKF